MGRETAFRFALGFGLIFMPGMIVPAMVGNPVDSVARVFWTLFFAVLLGSFLVLAGTLVDRDRARKDDHRRRRTMAQRLIDAAHLYADIKLGQNWRTRDANEELMFQLLAGPTIRILKHMADNEVWSHRNQDAASRMLVAQGIALDAVAERKGREVDTAWIVLVSGALRVNRDGFLDDAVEDVLAQIGQETRYAHDALYRKSTPA